MIDEEVGVDTSHNTQSNFEYPSGYFGGHEIRTQPSAQEWLLVTVAVIAGTVILYVLPIFFALRWLSRRTAHRYRRLIYLVCALSACHPFASTIARVTMWRMENFWRVRSGPNLREVDQRARAVHGRARNAVLAAERGQGRFVLMVRDFRNERDLPSLLLPTFGPRLRVEEGLARIFEGRMPVVTIANPASDFPVAFLNTGILRLFVSEDQWQDIFRRVASRAALILILSDGSGGSGLVYELTVVEELKSQVDSIVLTGDDFYALQRMCGEEFSLDDCESKVAHRTEEDRTADIGYESNLAVRHLLAKIAGDAGSGLVQLRDRFASGQL